MDVWLTMIGDGRKPYDPELSDSAVWCQVLYIWQGYYILRKTKGGREEILTDHDCDGRNPCSSSLLRNLSTPLLPITHSTQRHKGIITNSLTRFTADTKPMLGQHWSSWCCWWHWCCCWCWCTAGAGGTGDAGAAAAASLDLLLLLLCSLTAAACSSLGSRGSQLVRRPAPALYTAALLFIIVTITILVSIGSVVCSHRHFQVWNNKHSCWTHGNLSHRIMHCIAMHWKNCIEQDWAPLD